MNLLLACAQIGVLKSGTNGVHIKGHNLLMIFGSLIYDMSVKGHALWHVRLGGLFDRRPHRGGNAPVAASVWHTHCITLQWLSNQRFYSSTQVLIARGGGSAGNMAAGYWVQGISEAKEAEEELQCLALDVTNRNARPVQLSLCIYTWYRMI